MTNADIKTAIRDDLSIATGDLFYSDAYIQRVANRAVKWVASLHLWQQTQYAYKYDLAADDLNDEYVNYPEDFQTDSIWKLVYDGDNFTRIAFAEYLRYQEDESSNATDKIYSDHARQIFMNPAPATLGAEIAIFGHKIPTTMSVDADTHPFSGEATLEEAIVQYGLGLCLKKARGTLYAQGVAECNAAYTKVESVWKIQKAEQSKYQTKDLEMFKFFNVLPPNGGERQTQRGNFVTLH